MNDVIVFLQKLAETRHGNLEKARFAIVKDEINCRCPYCLDSQKNTRKRRFYFTLKDNVFFCHNCGRKGPFAKLLNDFKTVPGINYEKLIKEIGLQKVRDFIDGEHKIQNQPSLEPSWVIEFPDGARLDTLFENKVYKKLPVEDKAALLKTVKFLQSRGVKKEWFRYFYFVFPGEEHDQYIFTLFEYDGRWVWSGRKIDSNRQGPKYLHAQGFPFHNALGFANEVSVMKGNVVYVVESWFSALLMNQAKLNAVCVFGLQQMRFNHAPLDLFRKKYELIWCPDNDETFSQFFEMNKEFARKMKMIIVPQKDVGDYAVFTGDRFRKSFLGLPVHTLYNQDILDKIKTFI